MHARSATQTHNHTHVGTFVSMLPACGGCLQSGLGRLAEAASTIDELSQQAQVQRSLLARKQEEADQAMADIQVSLCSARVRLCNSSGPLLLTWQRLATALRYHSNAMQTNSASCLSVSAATNAVVHGGCG